MGHESFKGALKDGFINVGVSSISAFIANKIGQGRLEQLRGTNTVSDYVLHKMYHGVLGAARGVAFAALRGENVGSAALGGAVGGIVAEVVAEGMRESMLQRADGRFAEESKGLSDAKKIQLYNTIRAQELEKIRCCGEAASVIMATLFKCDIAHAQGAARNAIENNSAMAFSWGCPPDLMRNIQAALAAGAAGAVAAGEAVAAGVAAAGGAVVAASAVGVIVVVGGVYYYVTMDSEPLASAPKPESFPEEESKPKVHSTPVHDDSRPKVNSTPVTESSKPSDKGFDTYEGPDARVFTSDAAPKAKEWIRTPSSLQDQMALDAAKVNEGTKLPIILDDPRYKGMDKMKYVVTANSGNKTVVHYVQDPKTGIKYDFKFKKQSTDQVKTKGKS